MKAARYLLTLAAMAGLMAVTTACASSGELEETRAQVAALQQSMNTLTADLTAAQVRVSSLEEELAGLQSGLTGTEGQVSGLRVDLDTAQSNFADLSDDLTTATSDLGALKNTFLLAQDQRNAQHDSQLQADRLLLVHDLSSIAFTVTDIAAFDIATVAVGNAIDETGDQDLADAWDRVPPTYHAFLDAPIGSQEELDTFEDWRTAIDTFLGILQQRLTAGVG